MARPTKAQVRDVIEEVNELGLAEGAHLMLTHEKLGLEYGDVFDFIAADPDFYGFEEREG